MPLDRLNPLAAGLNLNPGLKNDASNKEIEEAMKRVREAQSLISAAIEPGSECSILSSPLKKLLAGLCRSFFGKLCFVFTTFLN